jgi:hypothetical protein
LWRGAIYIGGADPAIEAQVSELAPAIRLLLGDDGQRREWSVERAPGGTLLYKHPRLYKPPPEPEPLRMTFGRYRGCPLTLLIDDPSYVGWLLSQPWFAAKHPQHHAYLAAALERSRDDHDGAA